MMSSINSTYAQRPATILIVDDEPFRLRAIVAELSTLGFETLIARDGADGLAKAERGRPDLILLDILMPGWDGYETCRRLKATPSTRAIPVIFLSALCDAEQKLRGFEAGCIDYITKPFEQREVLARVSAHLQQQRPFQRMAEQIAPTRDGEQRLARAQVLLASGGLQIQRIADAIGSKRTGDFATAFKRRFGLTLRDYRRQRQSQPKLRSEIHSGAGQK